MESGGSASGEEILQENVQEERKKRKRENQNAYRQRQKVLKKNENEKKYPKSNADRQREFRQRNVKEIARKKLDDLQMKRQKLDSHKDQENVVQYRAIENVENVLLGQNQFLTQQLRIYEEVRECITPEVFLRRNTEIPGDGNCLFHSLIWVLQMQSTSDLRRLLRDSPYLNCCHNPEEAYNILSSNNDYGDLDCLYLFSKMYDQNICVHYHYFNVITKNEDTSFCQFKANDTHNWSHLDLRDLHFTPYFEVQYLLENNEDIRRNEVNVNDNIRLLRDNYNKDFTEDNHENELAADREDCIDPNVMDSIVDGTIPIYSNHHKHSRSHLDFNKDFTYNSFGHSCVICDRLWWQRDLKMSTSKHDSILKTILQNYTPGVTVQICSTCYTSLNKRKIPLMSTYNGFAYPKIPSHLPTLNLIDQRLISPRIPTVYANT